MSGDAAFCQVHCTQGQGCAKPDHCLTEANKLLEQTIEVLEGFEKLEGLSELPLPRIVIAWWKAKARPHLTKLKER
jgi:hypothetical protein